MNRYTRQVILIGVLSLLTATVQAQAYNHFDPRAHSELDQVVALCVAEPGSPRFDQAWLSWLAKNPEADVYQAVDAVVSRAGSLRSMAVPGMAPTPRGATPDPQAIANRMLSLAGQPQAR